MTTARIDDGELPPLRGFVGNAGIQLTNALTKGPDGFEPTFTVNVLVNHLLIRMLQTRFAASARIVITVSDTHFGDFHHNLGMVPGTGLARDADAFSRFAISRAAAGRHLADVVLGTTEAPTGSYVDRDRVVRSSDESYDLRREAELWDAAQPLTGAAAFV